MKNSKFLADGGITPSTISNFSEFISQEFYGGTFECRTNLGNVSLLLERIIPFPYPVSKFHVNSPYVYKRSMKDARNDPFDLCQIQFIRRGTISITQNGVSSLVRPNQIVLIRSSIPYREDFTAQDDPIHEMSYIIVPGDVLRRYFRCELTATTVLEDNERNEVATGLLDLMCREGSGVSRDVAEKMTDALLTHIGDLMAKAGQIEPIRQSTKDKRREDILAYIEMNYSSPGISLASVAEAFGLSQRYVSRLFHGSDNSFSAALWEKRLGVVELWLVDPEMEQLSLGELAHRAGFKSYPHFSLMFKSKHGVSPREFRGQGRVAY